MQYPDRYILFNNAIQNFGFLPEKLKLEYFREGTNNCVISLKYKNITWAVSILFPKTKIISKRKLEKYIDFQRICLFLTKKFQKGIPINENAKFIFDGLAFLCDLNSTKKFLKESSLKQKFILPKKIYVYTGPFFVKKGAPSSTTLEYNIDFKTIMLGSLAILHKFTGLKKLVDKKLAFNIISAINKNLDNQIIKSPKKNRKFNKNFEKYNQKWNLKNEKVIAYYIKREVIARSERIIRALVLPYIKKYKLNQSVYKCFIHGDAHGGNFIVVERKNKKEVHPIDVEEAKEKDHYLLDLVEFVLSAYNLSRIFRKPLSMRELIEIYYKKFDQLCI